MDAVLAVLAANAVTGTVLAAVTAVIGWRWRNPGVLHVLWLLVLAKMLVPPAMELRLLPSAVVAPLAAPSAVAPVAHRSVPAFPGPEAVPAAAAVTAEPAGFAPASADTGPGFAGSPPDPGAIALFAIALGAAVVLGLALFRVVRFRLLVRHARAAPEGLARRAEEIALRMGLRRAPRIRLADAHIPPVLWPGPPCEILLPAALAESLPDDELDAMLAHELGHVRRRDHWTRALELLAVAVFWWHPVVWWARRNLRAAEESCCDALVVRTLGDRSRSYADALVKTLEFLTCAPHRPVPALATGAGDFHRLKERLTMIVNRSSARPLSPWKHRTVLALALGALAVGPSWTAAETSGDPPPAPPAVEAPAVEAPPAPEAPPSVPFGADPELLQALQELQNESAALERRMADLERQRDLLQLRMEELETQRHAMDLREEAERLQKEGHAEQAELMRQQADLMREHIQLRRLELDKQHEQHLNRLEIDAKLQALEMRRAAAELTAQLEALEPHAD